MFIYVICLLVGLINGLAIGLFIMMIEMSKMLCGTIKKARDGGETYLFLELEDSPDKLSDKKYVIFKVDPKEITPHE